MSLTEILLAVFRSGIHDRTGRQGEVGFLRGLTAAGDGDGNIASDQDSAVVGARACMQDFDDQVSGHQVLDDDAVKIAAGGIVIVFEAGGLFVHDQVPGDGSHQIAVRDRLIVVVDDNSLGLDGVPHMEGGFLNQGEKSDIGMFDSKDAEGVYHVAHYVLAVLDGRPDQQCHI